jgi:hypothetical protein
MTVATMKKKAVGKKAPTHLYYVLDVGKDGKATALIMSSYGQVKAYAQKLRLTMSKTKILNGVRITTFTGVSSLTRIAVIKAKVF